MRKIYTIDESLTGKERVKARKRAAYLTNRDKKIEDARQYRIINADAIKASRKASYEKDPEKYKSFNKKWQENNPGKNARRAAEYRAKNPELIKEQKRNYYLLNKDKILQKAKEYASKNKDRILNYHRSRYEKMPELYIANEVKRRARKLLATPKWDIELTRFIELEAVKLCRIRQQYTGIKWHIDHVIPLRGKTVSGLHVWNNIAVIPAVVNLSKGNRYYE